MPSSLSVEPSPANQYLQILLDSARPFLRCELASIDNNLPSLVAVLRSAGAGECWHKHGTFFEHLFDVYRILKLWKAPECICLCGLFHSAYSNSYVNLAIFDPSTGREVVRNHVGEAAERLIHLFCSVSRQPLIHDNLIFKYSESELAEHLNQSEISVRNAKEKALFDEQEGWRKKLQSLLPAEGIKVKHIRTGEVVHLSRRVVATFMLITLADFSDQLFGFFDMMFENFDGRLVNIGDDGEAIWPGDVKPGLWMNSVSRIAAVYTLIVREEEIFMEEKKRAGDSGRNKERDEDIDLVVPPIFDHCTRVLDAEDQILARDMYWEAVCDMPKRKVERVEELLVGAIKKNPFAAEPYVVLGQVYMIKGRFEEAERHAERGLTLMLEWGSSWDKRISWEGWIAWARVVSMKAKEKSWPHSCWGMLKLGLVR